MSTKRVTTTLVIIAWLSVVAVLVFRGRFYVILNADSALFPMMGIDLRSWGGHWSEWKVGHIPYSFPDYAIYRTTNAVIARPTTALVVAGLLQCVFGLVGWSVLAARMIREPMKRACVLCLIPFGLVFQMCLPTFEHYMWEEVSLVHHGGILVAAPWSLLLAREALVAARGPLRMLAGASWILSSVLLIGSDRLSAVQLLAPTAVLVAAVLVRRSILRAVISLVALGLAVAAGMILEKCLLPQPVPAALRPPGTRFFDVIRSAEALLVAEETSSRTSILLMAALMLIGGVVGVVALFRRREKPGQERIDVVLVGLLPLTSLAAVVVGTAVGGPPFTLQSQRHIAFCFLVATHAAPIVLGLAWPALLERAQERAAVVVVALTSILMLLGVTGATGVMPGPGLREAAGGGVLSINLGLASECLNAETASRGLSVGIAEYWDAKLFSLLSGGRLRLIQVDKGIHQYDWVSNVEWANRFSPEFVLVGDDAAGPSPRPTEASARELFGMPSTTFSCHGVKALVYQGAAKRDFVQSWILQRKYPLVAPGDEVTLSARMLPGNGPIDASSRSAVEGHPDVLSYGPWMKLHPGDYQITIDAARERRNGATVGGWDIVLWYDGQPELTVISRGDLGATSEAIQIPLRVDRESAVEVRTFYSGQGSLRLDSIGIRRER